MSCVRFSPVETTPRKRTWEARLVMSALGQQQALLKLCGHRLVDIVPLQPHWATADHKCGTQGRQAMPDTSSQSALSRRSVVTGLLATPALVATVQPGT